MSKAVVIPECKKDIGGMKEEISISPSEKKEGAMGLFSRLLRFDSITKRSAPASPTSTEPPVTYYGVYIPCELKKGPDEEAIHVYKNKTEALELVRRYKAARFKQFKCHQEAVSFALRGAEPDHSEGNDSAVMGEKPYPFKAPSPQELVALRKAIEAGLCNTVRDRVWDNPRFLVSSGSTPAILQEGCRYNALHVAAKYKNAEICNLILTTVGNPAFVQKLYGSDADPEMCKELSEILVDRYLNTPDKARHDTPLHFAASFGAAPVVDVLTSYKQQHTQPRNKAQETPADVICRRVNASPETIARIKSMLQERYYVPVLHCEHEEGQPTIGRPFTPAQPPNLNTDPLSPRYEIRAYAGPMDAHSADHFHKQWRTPPRHNRFRLKEITKGLEVEGRTLADRMKVGWKEYWPFLDTFTDLRTTEGLTLLENYLKAKYESACSFVYSDSCIEAQHTPDDLNISRLSLGNFSHLGSLSSSPIKDMSPISELCAALRTCKISERPHWKKTDVKDQFRQRLCRQPVTKISNGDSPTVNHKVSQLLCIERTCQVFTKRIIDALTFCMTEQELTGHSLKCEYKNLQHTIFTYMDDERFQHIDVASIHARLAQLMVYKLKQSNSEDLKKLIEFLKKLKSNDDLSSDEDRKTVKISSYKIAHVVECHVRCLASLLLEELMENEPTKGPAISENECTEIWEKACKCRCDWKVEPFERNSKKNASLRKNRWALSVSPKSEGIIKRLTFDYDIGDGKLHSPAFPRLVSVNSPAGDSLGVIGQPGDNHPGHNPAVDIDKPGDNPAVDIGQPGDNPALYTIDVAKCQVMPAQISSDESASSSDDEYRTASEHSDDDDMMDASDRALAEPFIYGEEPSKMDRLVYEALSTARIDPEQYPNVYRWRHHIALYSSTERDQWQPAPSSDDSLTSSYNVSWSTDVFNDVTVARGDVTPSRGDVTPVRRAPAARSTPRKGGLEAPQRGLSLQMSNWLRVTGPNSPRSVLASKNVGHNVSFGF